MNAARQTTPVRVAFYGRVGDGCDPAHAERSLARQYQHCLTAVPADAITAAFFDIGSLRHPQQAPTSLELGHRRVHRDGGLSTLFEEAERQQRRFDFVISAEIDRLARQMTTALVGELADSGIEYLIATEIRAGEPLRIAAMRLRTGLYLDVLIRIAAHGGRR